MLILSQIEWSSGGWKLNSALTFLVLGGPVLMVVALVALPEGNWVVVSVLSTDGVEAPSALDVHEMAVGELGLALSSVLAGIWSHDNCSSLLEVVVLSGKHKSWVMSESDGLGLLIKDEPLSLVSLWRSDSDSVMGLSHVLSNSEDLSSLHLRLDLEHLSSGALRCGALCDR